MELFCIHMYIWRMEERKFKTQHLLLISSIKLGKVTPQNDRLLGCAVGIMMPVLQCNENNLRCVCKVPGIVPRTTQVLSEHSSSGSYTTLCLP